MSEPDDEPPLPGRLGRLAPLLVALAACLVYADSLRGVFLFDDFKDIVDNDDLHVLWPPWVPMGLSFRQIVYYSFAVNHAISGHETWSYHLVNGALHVLAALALMGVVRQTLTLPRLGFREATATRLGLTVALVWAVHPLNTQAVVYIVQRAEVMSTLAYLLVLYAFVRAAQSTDAGRRRWYVVTIVTFFLGLATKEVIATAPLTLYLLDAVVVTGSFASSLRRRWPLYALLIAPFVVTPLAWLAIHPERFVLLRIDSRAPDQLDYFLAQGRVIVEYVRLALWPARLNLDHGWNPAEHSQSILPAFALVSVVFLGVVESVRRKSAVGWLALTFFLVLAPSSSLFPLADHLVEHRMYPALIPLVVLVVLGVRRVIEHAVPRPGLRVAVGAALVLATTAALGVRTRDRVGDYASRAGMWRDVLAQRPHNPRAHYNLGLALLEEDETGNEESALSAFRRALELDPAHRNAHHNAGAVLSRQGEHGRAAWHFRTALSIGRKHPFEFLLNYANTLVVLDRHDEAAVVFERALDQLTREREKRHHEPATLDRLGSCYAKLGRGQEAVAAFQRAVQSDPTLDSAQTHLLQELVAQQRLAEAVNHAREVCRTQPESVHANLRLAHVLTADNRIEDAVDAYLTALALRPTDVDARLALTQLCVQPEYRERAVVHLEGVARRAPDDVVVEQLLGMLRQLR